MEYRKEIDGLRAIAVIPVVLFHAGFDSFKGGFIGVDIFFVISGFLISSIIYKHKSNNDFSFVYFYERRARRILPALSVTLLASFLFAWVYLNPADLKGLSESIVAASLFSSNILFYLQTDYFSPAANEIPLLHTWSLAIEEQFYIVFPVLITILWHFGKSKLFILLFCLAAFSYLAFYFTGKQNPPLSFYMIHTRAWELLAGSLLAIAYPALRYSSLSTHKQLLSLAGLVIICLSFVIIDAEVKTTGAYLLLPVLGTSLIILFADNATFTGRLLAHPAAVFIGLISYSLYLWHHPVLIFINLKTVGSPDTSLIWAGISCSLILAFLSWKFVEQPFRIRGRYSRKSVFTLAIATSGVLIAAGTAGHFYKGFPDRYDKNILSATAISSPKREQCHTKGEDYLKPENACRYFGEKINWAVLGDSHVTEIGYALAEQLNTTNHGLLHLSFSDCPPAFSFKTNLPGCSRWLKEAVNTIVNDHEIDNVLIGFRYSFHLYGNHAETYPDLPTLEPARIFADNNRLNKDEAERLYWQSVEHLIQTLLAAGKRVFILYPVPEIPMNIHKAIHPFSIFNHKPLVELNSATTLGFYAQRHAFILNKLDSLPYSEQLIAIKPTRIFCDETYCKAAMNNQALYFDDDHPSISGARYLVQLLTPYISTQK